MICVYAVAVYLEGILNGEQLLSHNTEHFNVNAVELVKAGPGSRLGQASKEFTHEAVVQPFTTVEHHTVHSQGLAQILAGHKHSCQASSLKLDSQADYHVIA